MLDILDRYSLALAVLNGEKDAHKILADVLEESGERGLAQWARSRKNKNRKRLDFVLAIMPFKTAALLACDYVEHLGTDRLRPDGQRVLQLVRSTLEQSEVSSPWLTEPRKLTETFIWPEHAPWIALECLKSLIETGQQALFAAWHQQRGQHRESASDAQKSQVEPRRTAKLAQHLAAAREPGLRGNRWHVADLAAHHDLKELLWQIEHTKQILERLLQQRAEGNENPWPK